MTVEAQTAEKSTAEKQKELDQQGLAMAGKAFDENPDLAKSVKENLVGMNGGNEVSPKQIETLTSSGNYMMAEAARRELTEVNMRHAEEHGKSAEEYEWYMQKAKEHLELNPGETAQTATDRLKSQNREFDAHIMSRFI